MLIVTLLSLLFASPSLAASPLEEFRLRYGTKSFYGKSCKLEKCRFPELYQAHHAKVEVSEEALTLSFEKNKKTIFPALRLPKTALHYYQQETFAPHEGYETERTLGARRLVKSEKAELGFRHDFYEQPVFSLRLVKFKQKKEDERWDYGVELIYGVRRTRVLVSPEGRPQNETELGTEAEVENQYLVGRAPREPGI